MTQKKSGSGRFRERNEIGLPEAYAINERSTCGMKTKKLFLVLPVLLCLGCTSKQRQEALPNDTLGIEERKGGPEEETPARNTLAYRIPECALLYTDTLPEAYKEKTIRMWTERKRYEENVQVIRAFVANPTPFPLFFGRGWNLWVWKEGKWDIPGLKVADISWKADGFRVEEAPLLYCFRFHVASLYDLPPGKYCLEKAFYQAAKGNKFGVEKEIKLQAEFEIK